MPGFKSKVASTIEVLTVSTLCVLIILKADAASEGIRTGLKICAGTVIPSLFPFTVLSSFIIRSGIYAKIGKIFGKVVKILFALPEESAGVIAMGLIGGYPIGAKMTAALYRTGTITERDGKRLISFCVNAGPAFTVAAVGNSIYNSASAGILLFLSVLLSSLTLGIIQGLFFRVKGEYRSITNARPSYEKRSDAFINSVYDGARAMFSICAWVTMFSALTSLIKLLPLSERSIAVICGICEVTTGCNVSAHVFPLAFTAALISFSGICIFCQISGDLKEIGTTAREFFSCRAVCAVLSYLYCALLAPLFPETVTALSNNVHTVFESTGASIPAAICLMLTCALFIFEVDKSRRI